MNKKPLNSKTIESTILNSYESTQDWIETYGEISNKVMKIKSHNPLEYSFNSFFLYTLIKHKVDIKEFSQVVRMIYESKISLDHSTNLTDLFSDKDSDNHLQAYTTKNKNKYENKADEYDNMHYVFLSFDKNKTNGQRVLLDKDNLPYLLVILKEVTLDTVPVLWNSSLNRFIDQFISNIAEIKPLLMEINKNKAFELVTDDSPMPIFDHLINRLSNASYDAEIYPNQNTQNFDILIKVLGKNLKERLAQSLIKVPRHNRPYDIDLALVDYSLQIPDKIDIIDLLDHAYKKHLKTIKEDKLYELMSQMSVTLDMQSHKSGLQLDTTKIDTNKDFGFNLVHLKALQIKVDRKEKVEMENNVAQYILKIVKEQDYKERTKDLERFIETTNLEEFARKHIEYQKLDKALEKKSTNKKGTKI